MDRTNATFSEHWHRVAGQKVWLLPGVRVRRQFFRGERWHVLEHPFANRFFRLRPAAYFFVARLSPDRTVEQVWREILEEFPEEAPGQEAVVQLLGQLYAANLIHYPQAQDSAPMFERYRKRKEREWRSTWLNIMFLRIPLWDPDVFLQRTLPWVRFLFSRFGAVLWFFVLGWGIKSALDRSPELWRETQGILNQDNLPWLYACLAGLKLLHELGHAYACRFWGGQVHTLGVMLMIFTPVPYVDATSSWGFRSRFQRIMVGAAGMVVELFVAGIACILWANTGEGTLHSVAYNIMFIASFSTLVFNLNPLLRFDGYYMLSDWIGIPNLQQRANQLLREVLELKLFGLKPQRPLTVRAGERFWLVAYGLSSHVYRIVVFAGILLFVADRFLIIGLLVALSGLVSWLVVPLGKFVHYLWTSPALARKRPRALAVSAALAGFILVLAAVVPFPHAFRAPGIIQAARFTEMTVPVDGRLVSWTATSGSQVRQGDILLTLENPELDSKLIQVQAQEEETRARLRQAQPQEVANVKPLQQRLETLLQLRAQLESDRSNLVFRARHDGIWIAPNLHEHGGSWVGRGTALGILLDPAAYEFVAVVNEEDGDALFNQRIRAGELRIRGQSGEPVRLQSWKSVPGEQRLLPSAALGWKAGGELAVQADDPSGRQTAEPFFQLTGSLAEAPPTALWHGRRGVARFELPPEPLLPRAIRHVLKLIQRRYGL